MVTICRNDSELGYTRHYHFVIVIGSYACL